MKRIFLSLLSLFVSCIYVFATPISENEARDKALQFVLTKKGESSARSAQRFGGSGGTGATLTMAESQEAFYVFNIDSVGGYVIVSGDDRMPDVLGYSYSGTYKSEEIPDNMRSWLESYAEQYEYLQTHSDAKGATLTTVTGDGISPMLDCHWNQRSPYNILCPQGTLTGCVATAMAQIMYYHQWPKQTTETIPAYTTRTRSLPMPEIGITAIDWDNITPTYSSISTEEEIYAIGNLMRLCGSAVEMDYTSNASSASCYSEIFVKYFGYSRIGISDMFRNNFSDEVWNQMIYDELKEGRPVFYSGQSSSGGHAFIIDGYGQNDYFHVNWGWGGYQDNYFLLGALNGYNYDQDAIIGINTGQTDSKLPYTELSDGVLTFYYDNKHRSRSGKILSWDSSKWDSWEYRQEVKSVVFDPSCAEYKYLSRTDFMFESFSNLVSIQGLSYLVTENVTNMAYMFLGCKSLTSLDVSSFDTRNVKNMRGMFSSCFSLTSLDVSSFDTRNVTDMSGMFSGCSGLISLDVSNFDTHNVTDMSRIFSGCSSLTSIDVQNFYTENVTNMWGMFYDCSSLTTLDISNFKTQNVTDMGSMFDNCSSIESLDVRTFDTGKVMNMEWMFYKCSTLTSLDVSNFNIENVTNMSGMFDGCSALATLDVSNFKTENVTDMQHMFSDCSTLTSLDISNFNTQNVVNMQSMFSNCSALASLNISNLNTDNVTNMSYMFYNCPTLSYIDLSQFNTQNVTDMQYMFYNCSSLTSLDIRSFDTGKVTDMGGMFGGCCSVESLDVSGFKTENVTDMSSMFYNCSLVKTLDVSKFDTGKVTDMEWMFERCSSIETLDVRDFNTENVTNMSGIFSDCSALTSIDVSNFDTGNVTNMSYMFNNCKSLPRIVVSFFGTETVTNMAWMFSGCELLKNLDVSDFDTQNVTSMRGMFYDCSGLTSLDVKKFNTENVTDLRWMFGYCSSLQKIYTETNWNTNKVTDSNNMFYGCYNLVGQGGTKYSYDHSDKEYARIDNGVSAPGYFSSKTNTLPGDVNGDGVVNGTDIQAIINLIVAGEYDVKADVNKDNVVNGTDIQEVINIIVEGK